MILSRALLRVIEVMRFREERYWNGDYAGVLKAKACLFVSVRVLLSPQFHKECRHVTAHYACAANDGVAGRTERDHQRQP